mmetsp:Transcript_6569/g.17630  ORF Transcript_6569/g.17630 Transcript_6569/m.17630 type:complete len:227 (+) Transcript_6569:1161-1841(+)
MAVSQRSAPTTRPAPIPAITLTGPNKMFHTKEPVPYASPEQSVYPLTASTMSAVTAKTSNVFTPWTWPSPSYLAPRSRISTTTTAALTAPTMKPFAIESAHGKPKKGTLSAPTTKDSQSPGTNAKTTARQPSAQTSCTFIPSPARIRTNESAMVRTPPTQLRRRPRSSSPGRFCSSIPTRSWPSSAGSVSVRNARPATSAQNHTRSSDHSAAYGRTSLPRIASSTQ